MDNPFGDHGADGDPDGDGFDNRSEYAFDISPRDGTAMPRASIAAAAAPGFVKLTFPVLKSRRYQVQRNGDLTGWTNAGAEITPAADNPDYEWTDPAPLPGRRFYRVSVRVP